MRKPGQYKGLQVTKRDEIIMLGLFRYRFMTTEQIEILTGSKSRRKINDRLRQLWGNDLLDRPSIQRELYSYAKKRPTIHALGPKGAAWLTTHHDLRFPKTVDWKAKNRALKSGTFLEHTLGITDTMLKAERSLSVTPGLRLVDREEIWTCSPRFHSRITKPFELRTEIRWTDGEVVKRRTKPDYTFAISDLRGDAERRGLYFLEYDNNTEDFIKSRANQTSILQKLLGYADARTRTLHTKMYGYKNFRVLFVVAGKQSRVESMIAVYQSHVAKSAPAGMFLFTTKDELDNKGFLAPIWQDGKRNTISLVTSQNQSQTTVPRTPHQSVAVPAQIV